MYVRQPDRMPENIADKVSGTMSEYISDRNHNTCQNICPTNADRISFGGDHWKKASDFALLWKTSGYVIC